MERDNIKDKDKGKIKFNFIQGIFVFEFIVFGLMILILARVVDLLEISVGSKILLVILLMGLAILVCFFFRVSIYLEVLDQRLKRLVEK